MARRILITGSVGFVGRHLLRALSAMLPPGDEVIATALAPLPPDLPCRQLDVGDAAAVRAALRELRPTHTVHLAGLASPPEAARRPGAAWQVNVAGTINVAESVAAEAPGGMLLCVSTAEVYGRSFLAGRPLDEAALLDPATVYARSKAAAEAAARDILAEHGRLVIVRPFNHTGPGQDERFVVPAFAAQVARIRLGLATPVLNVGNLSAERDFLDVRDVVRAYGEIILGSDALPAVATFNVASGQLRRIGSILDDLRDAAGCAFEVRHDPERQRPSEIPRMAGDGAALSRALGWRPQIDWRDTVGAILDDWTRRLAHERAADGTGPPAAPARGA
ncbi:GDP-mannose 4,6-dehydratase [Chelatococcus reniformis]|uniref:GDP-6-deoxy-D-lyxo-4-hexulose reductase n=1 Tax=Chelatococcus reniformis TaxID=1494448 RepID=A0A916U181_9HYPH|nr:GDP-mannose 4,6-dehydratase [Chelatococcus reniformis]GGC56588.1 GDP-6-deoxy-D-lyxo-4-hexulose reductase [Chelatococcus reniformis]